MWLTTCTIVVFMYSPPPISHCYCCNDTRWLAVQRMSVSLLQLKNVVRNSYQCTTYQILLYCAESHELRSEYVLDQDSLTAAVVLLSSCPLESCRFRGTELERTAGQPCGGAWGLRGHSILQRACRVQGAGGDIFTDFFSLFGTGFYNRAGMRASPLSEL